MADGFLYSVRAVVDKGSFSDAISELNKLGESSKKIIAGIAGISAAVIGSASIAGEVSTQELKMAKAIGTSSEALSSWKIAASVAGASASGLVSSLASLENKMQHLKTGSVDTNLAKNLGMMGIGYGDFSGMDSEKRMKVVFEKAEGMDDQQLAATLVGDVLGQAGREYYDMLKLSGKSLSSQLAEARALNMVSSKNRKESSLFLSEVKAIKESGKSMAQLFGAEIGAALLPTARRIKKWIIDNRETIIKSISGFARQTGAIFDMVCGVIGKVAPIVTGLIDKFGGLDKIVIKLGIGLASLKLAQFAMTLKSVFGGISMLKVGLGGLLSAGIGLLLDDILSHLGGKRSVIFDDILPALDKLRKKIEDVFGIKLDSKTIVDAFGKIRDSLGNLLEKLGEHTFASFERLVTNFKNLSQIVKDLIRADWSKLGQDIKKFFSEYWSGVKGEFNLDGMSKAGKEAFDKTKAAGGGTWGATASAMDAAQREIPIWGLYYAWMQDQALPWIEEKITGKKADKKVNDAIISPNGQVTALSPQDWVFALKDVSDLAGGFVPGAVAAVNNNTNAPSSYIINQSYTVNGGNPEMVRMQAYRGTESAIRATMSNTTRIMQMMPGTR